MGTVVLADGTRTSKIEPFFGHDRWKRAQTITYNADPCPDPGAAQAHLDLYYPDGAIVCLTRGPKGGWIIRGFLGIREREAVPKTFKRYQMHLGRFSRT